MRIFFFLLVCVCFSLSGFTQVKTGNSDDKVFLVSTKASVKYGDAYTPKQIKDLLGAPDKVNSWRGEYGMDYEFNYKDGLFIRFNDDYRSEGLHSIYINSNHYTLRLDDVYLTVGESVDRLTTISRYTGMEPIGNKGWYTVHFGTADAFVLEIKISADAKILVISYKNTL